MSRRMIPRTVSGVERIGERDRDVDEQRHVERAGRQAPLELLALQQLHDQKRLTVRGLADVVDGADVRTL